METTVSRYKDYRSVHSVKDAWYHIDQMMQGPEKNELWVVVATVPRKEGRQMKREIVARAIREAEEAGLYEISEHLSGDNPFGPEDLE